MEGRERRNRKRDELPASGFGEAGGTDAQDDGGAVVLTPPMESKELARVIGANLKFLRKQKFPGWGGQKRFADFLGINPNDLCVYEYGRSVPNEQRLNDFAGILGLTADALRSPLPGVKVPPAMSLAGPTAASERVWRERVDELKQTVARLEGKLEATQAQVAHLEDQASKLREANYVLRSLLYADDTEDATRRRQRVLERLDVSTAQLMRLPDEF